MRQTLCFALPAMLAIFAYPSPSQAQSFAFSFGYHDFGSRRIRSPEADVDDLDARIRYVGGEWEVVVQYEVEVERAPVGYCDLVLDIIDRDHAAAPLRVSLPLDRPTEIDDDEIEYEGQTRIRLTHEQVRDPERLRLYGYAVVAGGGPVLDRESTKIDD